MEYGLLIDEIKSSSAESELNIQNLSHIKGKVKCNRENEHENWKILRFPIISVICKIRSEVGSFALNT